MPQRAAPRRAPFGRELEIMLVLFSPSRALPSLRVYSRERRLTGERGNRHLVGRALAIRPKDDEKDRARALMKEERPRNNEIRCLIRIAAEEQSAFESTLEFVTVLSG